ncbi:Na(+)/H(+) antiporter subunit D [Natronorarus salvus]|uniref:Na(+)/H(+) antiporter subunit D n=1 Tax=Natronorarus salvus TaxID=3117733 RepID=UPI002F2611CC
MSETLALAYPPFLVLAAALLVLVLPRTIGFGLGTLSLVAVAALSLTVPEGSYLGTTFLGFEANPYLVDEFTAMMGFVMGFLGAGAVLFAYSSEASRTMAAFALAYVASSLGAAFAGDWLVLVFYWEVMAVTSTLLVWHYGGDAVRAGYRYAIAHGIGGSLVLFAVVWHFADVGAFAYGEGAAGIAPGIPALLAALGIGVNVAFIGLHTWLPDTYPRPHFTASVFLAAYTTKTSAYVLYRAFPEGNLFLAYMGGLMAVYGVVFALLQHDMRALLSYHIQAQLGYMVAGIGIGTAIAVSGAMGHLFNNVLYKSLLFMAIGVVIYRTGENDLYELGGLWREMPITATAYAIGAFSIVALPGFNGFISKGMVFDAANPHYYGSSEYLALFWLLMIGAIGTFLSFIKLGYYTFLHGESSISVPDARPGQSVAMLAVAAACIVFGVWWQGLVDLLPFGPEVIGEGQVAPYSIGHLTDALTLLVVSVVGFALVRQPLSGLGDIPDVEVVLNPATYTLGRGTMLAVTDLYAAVDALAVSLVTTCYWIGNNPVLAVRRVGRRLPNWLVDTDGLTPTDGGAAERRPDGGSEVSETKPSTLRLRASIGTTVLMITVVLTVILWLVL